MDEILNVLSNVDGLELTDELKGKIKTAWKKDTESIKLDTDNLFTQEEVKAIINKRLGRAESLHEQEMEELKEEMKGLLDPKKVEEYKTKVKELEDNQAKTKADIYKDAQLKIAAARAGIKDEEYFDFLVEKNSSLDKLKYTDDEQVVVIDEKGNVKKDNS